jgi:hypothetical protein
VKQLTLDGKVIEITHKEKEYTVVEKAKNNFHISEAKLYYFVGR